MASLKEIRNRIVSVKNTQKITSAMKMVSAAKLKRAEDQFKLAFPYASQLERLSSKVCADLSEGHPLFKQGVGDKSIVIVISSDRGLCGNFNTVLCKETLNHIEKSHLQKPQICTFGRKAKDFFNRTPFEIVQSEHSLSTDLQIQKLRKTIWDYASQFEEGTLSQVFLSYMYFKNALTQTHTFEQILPVKPPTSEVKSNSQLILEPPSASAIANTLLKRYIENRAYIALLSTFAGEHASRMTAMDAATNNAGELIKKLQLFYNRTRQAAITKELIEIVSGAESL